MRVFADELPCFAPDCGFCSRSASSFALLISVSPLFLTFHLLRPISYRIAEIALRFASFVSLFALSAIFDFPDGIFPRFSVVEALCLAFAVRQAL